MPEMLMTSSYVWTVYMLQRRAVETDQEGGQGNRSLYVGMTNSLPRRLEKHNKGVNRATAGREWTCVAAAALPSKSMAATLEAWLKTGDTTAKRKQFLSLHASKGPAVALVSADLMARACTWKAQRDFKRGFAAQMEALLTANKEREEQSHG